MSQRGSIRRRGETWTAYWSTTNPDGSRRQRTRGGFPTKRAAQAHLTQVVPAVGSVPLHALTPAHVAGMVTTLRASGGKGGRPLGDRSVQLAYTILRAALTQAVRYGLIGRNPAEAVDRPTADSKEMRAWTAEETEAFLGTVAADRLYALWLLLPTRGPAGVS